MMSEPEFTSGFSEYRFPEKHDSEDPRLWGGVHVFHKAVRPIYRKGSRPSGKDYLRVLISTAVELTDG